MEPPYKRRRFANPDADLAARRARNDSRLKSIFESIFERYGKDFDGIGDEIDMRTGEIIVDNGHLQGMRNERDAGDAENSGDDLDSIDPSDLGDQKSANVPREGHEISPGVPEIDYKSYAPRSRQSIEDADSLMGDVMEYEDPNQGNVEPTKKTLIAQDEEEDELASKEFDWQSPRNIRTITQNRWRLHELEIVNDEATESAWRAPTLPKSRFLQRKKSNHDTTTFDPARNDSDDDASGPSIWALEKFKAQRRRRTNSCGSLERPSPLDTGRVRSPKIHNKLSAGRSKISYWTIEEDNILRRLKTTTTLTAREMEPYLPLRHMTAINTRWSSLLRGKRRRTVRMSNCTQHKTPSPMVLPTSLQDALPCRNDHQAHSVGQENDITSDLPPATLCDLDIVLDGLGKRVKELSAHSLDHTNGTAQMLGTSPDRSCGAIDMATVGNLPTPDQFTQEPQASQLTQGPEFANGSDRQASRSNSPTPSACRILEGKMRICAEQISSELPQHMDLGNSRTDVLTSPEIFESPDVEHDTVIPKCQSIEGNLSDGCSIICSCESRILRGASDDFVKAEPTMASALDDPLDKPLSEVETWWDQYVTQRTASPRSPVQARHASRLDERLSSPLQETQTCNEREEAEVIADSQVEELFSEREAIPTPSPTKQRLVQVVVPLITPIAHTPIAVRDKATTSVLEPFAELGRDDDSIQKAKDDSDDLDRGEAPERIANQILFPSIETEDPLRTAPEETSSRIAQSPEQTSFTKPTAPFIDDTESEDELSSPAIFHKKSPTRPRNRNPMSPPKFEIPDSQPTATPLSKNRALRQIHKLAQPSPHRRKLSSRLPLRLSASLKQQKIKAEIADSFDSISTTRLDDTSEDELSFM